MTEENENLIEDAAESADAADERRVRQRNMLIAGSIVGVPSSKLWM